MKLSPSRRDTATGRRTRTASSSTSMKLQRPTESWQMTTLSAPKKTSLQRSRARPRLARPALRAQPLRLHAHGAHVESLRIVQLEVVQLAVMKVADLLAGDADQVVVRLAGAGP